MTAYGLTAATVRFGDVVALDRVDLDVAPGEVVAVVGGDGAGKTTLLRALVGLVVLAAGTAHRPGAADVGYLPATAGSWLELTVGENLDFVGSIFGLRGQGLADRSEELAVAAGLSGATDRLSRDLSGGMRRKLGFSLALMHAPPLLVLDEPSTGVDPVSRVDLWRLVSRSAAAGAAVVMSTTYLDEAERASRLVVLDRGRVLVTGTPRAIVSDFDGAVTSTAQPVRPQWAWRRGRGYHEVWPVGAGQASDAPTPDSEPVTPDLEDVVIAMSLRSRAAAASAAGTGAA